LLQWWQVELARIDPVLESRLRENPLNIVRVIVHASVDPSEVEERLQELDVTILHSFSLIRAVAVCCPARTVLILLQEPWVEAIEEDQQVSVQA
jgi:hypothetical protein